MLVRTGGTDGHPRCDALLSMARGEGGSTSRMIPRATAGGVSEVHD